MFIPITIEELQTTINKGAAYFTSEQQVFYDKIKIDPVKWAEEKYGSPGDGFWVVAVFQNKVIWYNDIEEGFNISSFETVGKIYEYGCEQDEINIAVMKLFEELFGK